MRRQRSLLRFTTPTTINPTILLWAFIIERRPNTSRFSLHFPSCPLPALYDEYQPLSRPTPELHRGPDNPTGISTVACAPNPLAFLRFSSEAPHTTLKQLQLVDIYGPNTYELA